MGNAMVSVIGSIWEILCKACRWVLSKIECCLNSISEKTNNLVNRAKRFYDNFPEGLKDSIAEAKRCIDEKVEKTAKLVLSIKKDLSSSISTIEEAKEWIIQNKNLVSSMLKLTLDLVKGKEGVMSSFATSIDQVSRITGKNFDVGYLKDNMLDDLSCGWYLALGLSQLIEILAGKFCRILHIIVEACVLFRKERNMKFKIGELKKMEKSYFEMLESDERKAAVFVCFALQLSVSSFVT